MFMTLEELAAIYPDLRRYVQQGFTLSRPVLTLEMEFDIESINQTLRVNATNSNVRSVQLFLG